MKPFDAAVVGSGPNGLAAALALQATGRSVVMYEARSRIGGGLWTDTLTLPDFLHDTCSAVHPMAVASPYLRTLPLAEYGLEWVHPEVPLAHPLEDRPPVLLHRDVAQTAAELGVDGQRYERWMGPLVKDWMQLMRSGMGPPAWPASLGVLARFGVSAALPATMLARNLFREEPARALFAGLAAHSVLPLEHPPSAAIGMMLQIAGHAVGWPFPKGGAASLATAMGALFEAQGGVIRLHTEVTNVDAVETLGPVFFDTGPHALARIAGRRLPDAFVARLLRYRYGPGVFKVDYALSAPIPWRDEAVAGAGTVHLGGSLGEIAASEWACSHGKVSERPYVLVAQQSTADRTRAPGGHHTGWAYCHVPHDCPFDRTAAIEAQIERYAPGFQDVVLARHSMGPSDFERHNANYVGGDVNGGAATLAQLLTRPTVRAIPWSTPNPRIWICSASSPPGGGVHGMGGYNAVAAAFPEEVPALA
ncbi:MAG: FAD-dependent oxidoreductase [Deltaproteobacteria bacterium]|nr:FAD-dependent oxidoreductase [Deltaproteobacteria bacterium]